MVNYLARVEALPMFPKPPKMLIPEHSEDLALPFLSVQPSMATSGLAQERSTCCQKKHSLGLLLWQIPHSAGQGRKDTLTFLNPHDSLSASSSSVDVIIIVA